MKSLLAWEERERMETSVPIHFSEKLHIHWDKIKIPEKAVEIRGRIPDQDSFWLQFVS